MFNITMLMFHSYVLHFIEVYTIGVIPFICCELISDLHMLNFFINRVSSIKLLHFAMLHCRSIMSIFTMIENLLIHKLYIKINREETYLKVLTNKVPLDLKHHRYIHR